MEPIRLLDFLMFLASGLIGAIVKALWDAVRELRKDLSELSAEIPKEYVRKADSNRALDALTKTLADMREEMTTRLDQIWQKLDGKADR